jgi:PAS domain S-box-containing protein
MRSTKSLVIALWIFLCIYSDAYAVSEDMKFDHVFDLGNLGQQTFLQDTDGFLWFGTEGGGMIRYDGYDLKYYRASGDSLSSSYIYRIIEDSENPDIFWIGTKDGLNRFDKKNETCMVYKHDPNNPDSLSFSAINDVLQDPQASRILWIGTDNGLNRFDKKTEKAGHYRHEPGNPKSIGNNNVWRIIQDKAEPDILWIATWGGGLFRFDKKSESFAGYVHSPEYPGSLGHENNIVSAIAQDKADPDIIWAGLFNGLYKLSKRTGKFTHCRHEPDNPETIREGLVALIYDDGQGRLWIGGWIQDNGLSIFDKKTGTFQNCKHSPDCPGSLGNDNVVNVSRDRAGIFWITFYSGGVDKYDPWNQNFERYQQIPKTPNSLSNNLVTAIYEDSKETVWVGTQSGLNRFNKNTKTFTSYHHESDAPDSLDNDYIGSIFEDTAGRFWLGFHPGNILAEFDRNSGKIISRHRSPDTDIVTKIIGDLSNPDILWLALRPAGFGKFDKQSERFALYPPDPEHPEKGISYGFMYEIFHDRFEELIWLGGWEGGGLNRFDKSAETFRQYANIPGNPRSISADAIAAIYQNSPQTLWIGTLGGGLNKFDKVSETFVAYGEDSGVPANINSILEDDRQRLWLGTDQGLVRFNPETGTAEKQYYQSDGLQGDMFFRGSAVKTKDGQMWFGGTKGVNAFYPDEIEENPHKPTVVVTALRQSGEPLRLGNAPERIKEMTLDWQHNFFEFEFAALSFTRPQKNQYAYMLEGLDKDWYYAGNRRFGRYSAIPPGEYVLRIRGSNSDGVWNEQGTWVNITILAPFWETWWFHLLWIAGALGIASALSLSKIRRMKAEKAAAKEKLEYLHFLQELIDSVPNPIFYKDMNGIYLGCNRAFEKFTGRNREYIIGKTANAVFPQKTADMYNEKDAELLKFRGTQVYESPVKDPEGNERHMLISKVIFSRKDGTAAGLVGIATDVTEQKKLEARVRQSQKMDAIGTLAGGIAHDFNNILYAMMGYTELCLTIADPNTRMGNNLQQILKAGERAKDLVSQILTFSRHTEQELRPVQIKLIIKEALKLIRASLPATVEIRQNIRSSSRVMADPVQIHQIIMNLCTNAAHAMQENGGVLDVSLQDTELDDFFVKNYPDLKPGKHLNLTVSDTGHGISQRLLDRIFEPFFTTKAQGEGTGLGLAVVHGIVKHFRGVVSVYSEEGNGTTFNIYFPVAEKKAKTEPDAAESVPTGTERILFVDDEPAISDAAKQLLESLGYRTEAETDSLRALERFRNQPDQFDLVITDMTMPKMTGDRLAEAMRNIRGDIPVILCTGFSATIDEDRAKGMGIRAFVRKPVLRADIARIIRTVLEN